jgi:hypothetical protein
VPTQPDWLERLANEVTRRIYAVDVLSPIGCHSFYDEEDDLWEITVFASNTEVIGGKLDGKITASKFALDVHGVYEMFSDVNRLEWQSHRIGAEDELGAHVLVEGTFEGLFICLRVLAQAPERFHVARYVHAQEARVENVW